MMNRLKIGLQLYSVRQELDRDFEGTLAQVAKMGYQFVELAGLHGHTPEFVFQLLTKYKLRVVAMHCDVLSSVGLAESIYAASVFGCDYLVCPWVEPTTFSSSEGVRALALELNKANQTIGAAGKILCYHNHQFEFQQLDGGWAFDLFLSYLHPSIKIQFDLYNAACAGVDNHMWINHPQLIMLHFKDGAMQPAEPNTAIGAGAMNYQHLFTTIPASVEWAFVEIEACDSPKLLAVEMSLHTLKFLLDHSHK